MSNEVALFEGIQPIQIFTQPQVADDLISKIRKESLSVDRDISTEKGRDNIRSLAFKIARSKTALDKMGKDLVAAQKAQIAAVDKERGRVWDELEKLQEEIRAPLTEFENKEKARTAAHEDALLAVDTLGRFVSPQPTQQDIQGRLDRLAADFVPRKWEEFEDRAKKEIARVTDQLNAEMAARKKYDAEQAELARLREEEAERQRKAEADRIAREAAEKATREAEEKAAREKEAAEAAAKAEQERLEAARKAEQEAKEAAEREAAAAKARADQAERDRIAAAEKAEADKKAAAAKAEKEKQEAADRAAAAERQRAEKEKDDQEAAERKRAADQEHRKKINGEALLEILAKAGGDGITKEQGWNIVKAISAGEIPHVSIKY